MEDRLKEAETLLRETAARGRQAMYATIVPDINEAAPLSTSSYENTSEGVKIPAPPEAITSTEVIPGIITEIPLAISSAQITQKVMAAVQLKIGELIEELNTLEPELSEALPGFSTMNPELRQEIVSHVSIEEKNWEGMLAKDVVVDGKERTFWGGLFTSAKKEEFLNQKIIDTLGT
jgi:hypothetical protein